MQTPLMKLRKNLVVNFGEEATIYCEIKMKRAAAKIK
jgi:hypothetical protein